MADTVMRKRVESPTFGRGWLIWPGPSDEMRFTFEGASGEESTWTHQVRFTMDVGRGVITSDSPRRHRDVDRAEAMARGVEQYARYDQQIEHSDEEPRIEGFTEDHFLDEVAPDPEGWITLVTNDGEVFGFRRLADSAAIAAAE